MKNRFKILNAVMLFLVALVVMTSCQKDEEKLRFLEIENRSGEPVYAAVVWDYWGESDNNEIFTDRLLIMKALDEMGDNNYVADGGVSRFEYLTDNNGKFEMTIGIGIFKLSTMLENNREQLIERGFDKIYHTTLFQLRAIDYKIVYYGD